MTHEFLPDWTMHQGVTLTETALTADGQIAPPAVPSGT